MLLVAFTHSYCSVKRYCNFVLGADLESIWPFIPANGMPSDIVPICKALNHALDRGRILLEHDLVTLDESIGLDKDLSWLCPPQYLRSDLVGEELIYTCDSLIQFLAVLQVCCCLENLELLQELFNRQSSVTDDLVPIHLDAEITDGAIRLVLVIQAAELGSGGQKDLEDGVTSLHMRLTPFA